MHSKLHEVGPFLKSGHIIEKHLDWLPFNDTRNMYGGQLYNSLPFQTLLMVVVDSVW